ncbi:MAG TPA: rhamnan synthesis F family protein, partial [Ktedonobacterales bacterium]
MTLPGTLVVVVHAYYLDVFDELCGLLKNLLLPFDLDVAVTSAHAQQEAQRSIQRHGIEAPSSVRICPNRGRNFGTFLAEFSSDVLRHDFVLHLHTKKSLYTGGEQAAWRKDLYAALVGDRNILAAIGAAFTDDPALGVIYPETAPTMPYWAHHWLSNGHLAQGLFDRLGVSEFQRTGYFDYPVGGMFWARVDAIRPLFAANFTYDDFPPESGQTDGALAHAIERSIVQIAQARRYTFKTVNTRTQVLHSGPSHKNLNMYAEQTPAELESIITEVDLVSFDVFDTLIMRPARVPDAALHFVGFELAQRYPDCQDFFSVRKRAEEAARAAKQHRGDVTIDDIYAAFPAVAQWPAEVVTAARALELETELRICQPRAAGVRAALAAKAAGKRCIVISDTYLTTEFVRTLLAKAGLEGVFDAYYVSSEQQARKDRGDLWQVVQEQEHATPVRWLHIGDNEHSDIQLTTDRGIRAFHLMNPGVLAHVRGLGSAPVTSEATWPADIVLGPAVNRIAGNPFLGQQRLRPIQLETAEDVGYTVFGPIVFGFTAWLAQMLREMDIDHAFFLSREGYGLRRCYEAMRELCPQLGLPPSTYFLSSRRTVLSAAQGRQFAPHLIFENKDWRGSLSGLVRSRIGLSLPPIIGADDIPASLTPEGEAELAELLDAIRGRIVAHGRQELGVYLEYCQTTGLSTAERPAVIDIGYSASIQRGLQVCLGRGITGLYMATFNTASDVQLGGGVARGFFTEGGELWQPRIPVIEHNLLLEALLTAPQGQFLTFERSDEGLVAQFKADTRSAQAVETILAMQQGAEQYCRDLLRAYGSALVSLPVDRDAIQEPLRLMGAHDITIPRAVQETFVLEDDFTGRKTRDLTLSPADTSDRRTAHWQAEHAPQQAAQHSVRAREAQAPSDGKMREGHTQMQVIDELQSAGWDPGVTLQRLATMDDFGRLVGSLGTRRTEVERHIGTAHLEQEHWTMGGYCEVCQTPAEFRMSWEYSDHVVPNFREHLQCPGCGLNNRQRFVA